MNRLEALRVLELSPGASAEEVAGAYRRLARKAHPDAGGDGDQFARLNDARDALLKQAPIAPVVVVRRSSWLRRRWRAWRRPPRVR